MSPLTLQVQLVPYHVLFLERFSITKKNKKKTLKFPVPAFIFIYNLFNFTREITYVNYILVQDKHNKRPRNRRRTEKMRNVEHYCLPGSLLCRLRQHDNGLIVMPHEVRSLSMFIVIKSSWEFLLGIAHVGNESHVKHVVMYFGAHNCKKNRKEKT